MNKEELINIAKKQADKINNALKKVEVRNIKSNRYKKGRRMKAVLVIDMPDEDLRDYYANIEIFKDGVLRFSSDDLAYPYRLKQRFKPLPQKKKIKKDEYGNEIMFAEDVGYNKCLDDILGDNDD